MDNIQSVISSGLTDIVTILVGILLSYLSVFIKQHFSSKQISTASAIAFEAVHFAEQLNLNNSLKYLKALDKAKELASKVGINLTDSQWETLIESNYKRAKNELESLVGTATPYTQEDIARMIEDKVLGEVQKLAPSLSADQVSDLVKPIVDKALSSLSVSVVVQPPSDNSQPSQ